MIHDSYDMNMKKYSTFCLNKNHFFLDTANIKLLGKK